MSATYTALGTAARVAINQIDFAVTEGQYRLMADAPTDDDTEAQGFRKFKENGNLVLEVDVTARKQTDVAPHVPPLSIIPGSFVQLELWPTGAANDKYLSLTFLVTEFTGSFRVAGSEPQTIRITGKSSGEIQLPDD